jgi:hypothetical protein
MLYHRPLTNLFSDAADQLTATTAASGEQQQSATAHDTRVAGANLAYATPEKQTVEDHHRSAATVAKTVAKPLDGARRTWTTLEYRPSLRPVTDGPGRVAHSYGSDAPRSKRVPVACLIGRSSPGTHGHARTVRHVGPPADGQADPLRKPTFSAGGQGRTRRPLFPGAGVGQADHRAATSTLLSSRP